MLLRNIALTGLLAAALGSTAAQAQDQDFAGGDVVVDADATWHGVKSGIGTFTVAAGVRLTVTAMEALEVRAETIVIEGELSANGRGHPGVAGSGASGRNGNGPGAGGAGGSQLVGGGGGGHGGDGGCGGRFAGSSCGGAGGAAYGSPLGDPQHGSSGGSGGGVAAESPGGRGGAGGGVIVLRADALTISGAVTADGATGGVAGSAGLVSGGGGGAGGTIVLEAETFDVSGTVSASGGAGGSTSCSFGLTCAGGGGGGGGLVRLLHRGAAPDLELLVGGGSRGSGPPRRAASGGAGVIVTDALPRVIPAADALEGSGEIAIDYALEDADGHPCSLEVTLVRGGTAAPATQGAGGDGTSALEASAGGTDHRFVWDAARDLDGPATVELHLRARDLFGWGPTAVVTVTANDAPAADGGTPGGDGGVPGLDGGTAGGDGGSGRVDAGASPDPGPDPDGDGGCSCHAAPGAGASTGLLPALALGVALLWRRRRR